MTEEVGALEILQLKVTASLLRFFGIGWMAMENDRILDDRLLRGSFEFRGNWYVMTDRKKFVYSVSVYFVQVDLVSSEDIFEF